MTEQGQGDGCPVSEGLVALIGQREERIDVAIAGFRHREADANELLLRCAVGAVRGFPVPLGGVTGVAGCVEQARLEQQGIRRLPKSQRAIDGTQGLLLIAVAPVDVSDRQMVIGSLRRGFALVAGEDAETLDGEVDTVVLKHRLLVQRVYRLYVNATGSGIRPHHLGEGAGRLRLSRQ